MANVTGTNGADNLVGTPDPDLLRGLGGNDTLAGLGGDDTIRGGNGNDLTIWNNGDDNDIISGGNGNDRVRVSGDPVQGDDFVITDDGPKQVTVQRTNLDPFSLDIDNIERLVVRGLRGNETFATDMSVSDRIKQVYNGGIGVDTIDLSDLDHGVFVDTDQNSRGFAGTPSQQGFVRDIDDLSQGTGAEIPGVREMDIIDFEGIVGTDFGDLLFGGQENDTIFGGAGDDSIHPFAGVNFVDAGDGTDMLLLNAFPVGAEIDLATDTATNNVIANFENATGSAVGSDIINGDGGANLLIGLGGSDTIRGAGGNDTLLGGDGNDNLFGGRGNDSIEGGAGTDVIMGGPGRDTISGAESTGIDQVTGGRGRDTFIFGGGDGGYIEVLDYDINRDVIALAAGINASDVNTQPTPNGIDILTAGNTIGSIVVTDPNLVQPTLAAINAILATL